MPVSPKVQQARQARYDERVEAASAVIPMGSYCHQFTGAPYPVTLPDGTQTVALPTKHCPFYKFRRDKPAQQNGYCRFLRKGDFGPRKHHTSLLWDGVKECDINLGDDLDESIGA